MNLYYKLSVMMGVVVVLSNYLVQFPVSYFGLNEVAKFWESVVNMNNWHQNRISEIVVKKLFGSIATVDIEVLSP